MVAQECKKKKKKKKKKKNVGRNVLHFWMPISPKPN